MIGVTIPDLKIILKRTSIGAAAIIVVAALLASMLWRDRVSIEDIALAPQPHAFVTDSDVTITWFGAATLLFDDGETQILVDAYISRPGATSILTGRPIDSDYARINWFLNEYRIRRLAAIIPGHSHFDHALDIGAIANRSSASVIGSPTTAQIARGAGVPEDQIVIAEMDSEYTFGQFTVRLIEGRHAPIGWRGQTPFPGTVDEPLPLPQPVTAFREGTSYSIVISHPAGTTLVQGSAGFRDGALDDIAVDAVALGVGLLEGLGDDYLQTYWQATVTATGARRVFPVHFDDFLAPFGETELLPRFLDDFSRTAELLEENRRTWDSDTELFLPEFGQPIAIYAVPEQQPGA